MDMTLDAVLHERTVRSMMDRSSLAQRAGHFVMIAMGIFARRGQESKNS